MRGPDLHVLAASSRDAALAGDGWERRSVATDPRLREIADAYTAAGFEVRIEPFTAEDLRAQCTGCSMAHAAAYIVYTRRRP